MGARYARRDACGAAARGGDAAGCALHGRITAKG